MTNGNEFVGLVVTGFVMVILGLYILASPDFVGLADLFGLGLAGAGIVVFVAALKSG